MRRWCDAAWCVQHLVGKVHAAADWFFWIVLGVVYDIRTRVFRKVTVEASSEVDHAPFSGADAAVVNESRAIASVPERRQIYIHRKRNPTVHIRCVDTKAVPKEQERTRRRGRRRRRRKRRRRGRRRRIKSILHIRNPPLKFHDVLSKARCKPRSRVSWQRCVVVAEGDIGLCTPPRPNSVTVIASVRNAAVFNEDVSVRTVDVDAFGGYPTSRACANTGTQTLSTDQRVTRAQHATPTPNYRLCHRQGLQPHTLTHAALSVAHGAV